jgi:hypothetical protein
MYSYTYAKITHIQKSYHTKAPRDRDLIDIDDSLLKAEKKKKTKKKNRVQSSDEPWLTDDQTSPFQLEAVGPIRRRKEEVEVEDLSEYEKLRKENIRRNQEVRDTHETQTSLLILIIMFLFLSFLFF